MNKPSPVTIDVNWAIKPATSTFDPWNVSASNPANDQWRQDDTIGPQPSTPPLGPPETDGGGSGGMNAK